MRSSGTSKMAFSRPADLRAVWLVRWRRLLSQLEFWLVLIGYNRRTRSFSSRIYLVYVIIFFSLWIFMVLTLLADFGRQVLEALSGVPPLAAAVALGEIVLVIYFLIELYLATRRSPFVFSEADSHLLCLSPVDRRYAAILWLLGAWLERGLFLWPGAVVLGYALLEAQLARELTVADLPLYLLAGWRMLVVAVLLHLAAQSLAWSAGAWRLQGKRDLPMLRWAAPLLALLLVAGWLLTGPRGGVVAQIGYWAAVLPLEAGLGAASLPAGLGLALVWAFLGMAVLWSSSREMSLARASQETRGHEAMQAAVLTGAFDLRRELAQRQRLGTGRRPSRLPARAGQGALVWRNAVQGGRSLSLGQAIAWVSLIGLSLGVVLVTEWGARAWFVVLWLIFAGQRTTLSLRKDLSRWWLLRQLPYPSENLVLSDMILPLTGIGLVGLGILIASLFLDIPVPPLISWLFLPGVVGVALASAVDILLQCRAERLLAGNVPGLTLRAVLLGALVLGLPGGLAWLALARWGLPLWSGILAMLAVSVGLDYALYRLAGSSLRRIR
jgi:hypothetical protein